MFPQCTVLCMFTGGDKIRSTEKHETPQIKIHLICCKWHNKIIPSSGLATVDLHLISPQSDTSLHCQTIDTGLVHHVVCLFTSQLSLVLTAPTHKGMARLS